MHVQLTRLFQNGTPLANGTRGIPAIDGDLNLSEQACPIWQRFGKQASLSRDGLRGHLVPQLFDAEVVELVENHLLLSGFEIDPSNNTSTAQLWSLVLPPGPIICLRLFDDEGRPLPRHRLAMLQPDVEGELRMTQKYDRLLQRTVMMADIRPINAGQEPPLPLRDARLLWLSDKALTVTGMVVAEMGRRTAAQTWYIEFVNAQRCPPVRADADVQGAGLAGVIDTDLTNSPARL